MHLPVQSLPAVLLWLLCSAPCAEVYQWTDERGGVHFGHRKLENVKQTTPAINTAHSRWQPYAIAIEAVGVELSAIERSRIAADVNNVYRFFDNELFFDMYKNHWLNQPGTARIIREN